MTAKRIIAIVLSAVLLAVSVFSLVWGIINFNKVKEGFKGSGLYTQTDIDAAYEDGYGEALGNKQEYDALIAEYRDKLADYEIIKKELAVSKDNINELNEKVYSLQSYISECETLIDKMKADNHRLQSQIKNECLSKYYETFAHTLDTADFVPAPYNDRILAYIFKNMRKAFKKIDREDRRFQRQAKAKRAQKKKQKKRRMKAEQKRLKRERKLAKKQHKKSKKGGV